MSAELESTLKRLLRLREGKARILKTRENTRIEFKQSFNFGSMPEYARTMMAYTNTDGGFIVYGVRNQPHEILGVNTAKFGAIDPAKITSFLNSHCSPELHWEMGTLEFGGALLGFLYTEPCFRKPVVTTATCGKELKEAEIYYRYRGQTSTIRFPELRSLIDALLDQERRGWLQHLSTISKAGAMNVAILDTLQGKLFGAGAPFLIDEGLLRQIKFIREGQFTEAAGAPTLRLVGEVRTVSGVTTAQVVQRGIHYDDLLTAFLASRPLSEDDAKSYLRESCHQMSAYSPIFYFVKRAGLTREQAVEFIQSARCGLRSTRATILQRLQGNQRIQPMSAVDSSVDIGSTPPASEIEKRLSGTKSLKMQRSILWRALQVSADSVQGTLQSAHAKTLLEAITHLDRSACLAHADALKQTVLNLFGTEFQKLNGNAQSTFRKAAAFLDEEINKPEDRGQESAVPLRRKAPPSGEGER